MALPSIDNLYVTWPSLIARSPSYVPDRKPQDQGPIMTTIYEELLKNNDQVFNELENEHYQAQLALPLQTLEPAFTPSGPQTPSFFEWERRRFSQYKVNRPVLGEQSRRKYHRWVNGRARRNNGRRGAVDERLGGQGSGAAPTGIIIRGKWLEI